MSADSVKTYHLIIMMFSYEFDFIFTIPKIFCYENLLNIFNIFVH